MMMVRILMMMMNGKARRVGAGYGASGRVCVCGGDTTPCRMTGVTSHSRVRYKEDIGPGGQVPPTKEAHLVTSV